MVAKGVIWVLSGLLSFCSPAWAASTITSIDFKQKGAESWVSISANESVIYTQEKSQENQQIILSFPDARLGPNARRYLDTSSFDSPVKLIQPFARSGSQETKVIIQLRKPATSQIEQVAQRIDVRISDGSSQLNAVPETRKNEMPEPAAPEMKSDVPMPTPKAAVPSAKQAQPGSSQKPAQPKGGSEFDDFDEEDLSEPFFDEDPPSEKGEAGSSQGQKKIEKDDAVMDDEFLESEEFDDF